jgi:signal transduction histidine kinase
VAVAGTEVRPERDAPPSTFRGAAEEPSDELDAVKLLRDLGERLVPEGNPKVLYDEVLQAAMRLANADAGTLQLLDEAAQQLVLLATHGFDSQMTQHFQRVDAASTTSCGVALCTGRRTVVHFDDPGAPDPHGDMRRHVEAGYRSAQSTPLQTRSGQPIGMISTHWRGHRVPTEREMRFLDLLARQAADLIERKRIDDALSASEARLSRELADAMRIHEISTRLIEADDFDALIEELLEAALALMQSSCGSVQVLDEATGEMHLIAWRGLTADAAAHWARVLPHSPVVCAQAIRERRRIVIADIEAESRTRHIHDLDMLRRCGVRALQSTPLLSRDGKPVGMLSTQWSNPHEPSTRDLRLFDIIARQAADLVERRRADAARRAADRRKDEFLATLAHELRNPLAPLRNGVQIARKSCGEQGTLRPVIDMMDRQLNHLVHLVDDLLDVGRIQSGTLKLRRLPVALNDVMAASAESARGFIDERGHLLDLVPAPHSPVVNADFDRLVQVFTNLLSNAAKFSPPGSVVRMQVESDGAEAVVRVVDRGIGIERDDLPRVFDLFSQVRAHQDQADGGLGVGLAIVRSLVTLHGGTVGVESDGPGAGSAFIVRLPVHAPRTLPEASLATSLPQTAARSRRILVVDDNVDAGDSLAALLQLHGQEVVVARDGVEAVRDAAQFRPDIILLDLGMPRMDGCEAARRIRALPGGRGMYVVALTGWGQALDRQRTRDAGFDRHLVKPVDEATLLEVLEGAPIEIR